MTLQELKKIYTDVFLLKDSMLLDVIVAVTIHGKMEGDGIWLLVVGGSSSGKSEAINSVSKVPFVFPVSTLTENTFLSNMRLGNGEEASLLHRIGTRGVITMKDFTSILAMRNEKSDVIISQLREIYDGEMTKLAGNGQNEGWKGKINWIGATTESVYLAEDETAGMGRRTINYVMPEQDRQETTRRAMSNNSDIIAKREKIQDAFAEYITEHVVSLPDELPAIPKDWEDELVEISDFITHARTPTARNYRGELTLVPSLEMPMRAFSMFTSLTKVLFYLHMQEGTLEENTDEIKRVVYKIALDSIPKQTMLALGVMAKYNNVTTRGVAQELRYPTETVKTWLENINVLGLCERMGGAASTGMVGPETFTINERFKDLLIKYGGIEEVDADLMDPTEIMGSFNDIQPGWGLEEFSPMLGSEASEGEDSSYPQLES